MNWASVFLAGGGLQRPKGMLYPDIDIAVLHLDTKTRLDLFLFADISRRHWPVRNQSTNTTKPAFCIRLIIRAVKVIGSPDEYLFEGL